jgi:hypothetical protein
MNDPSRDEINDRYNAAIVRWILIRLERLAAETTPPKSGKRIERILPRGFCARLWGSPSKIVIEHEPPKSHPIPSEEEEKSAQESLEEIERETEPNKSPLFEHLANQLGLIPSEKDILRLCFAAEISTRIGTLCAQCMDDPNRPYPTFALARKLFTHFDWRALTPESPLRRWQLVEIQQPAATPLIYAALRIDERILHFLKGWQRLDERLLGIVHPMPTNEKGIRSSLQDNLQRILLEWQVADQSKRNWPIARLLGTDPVSKTRLASEIAQRMKRSLFQLPIEQLPTNPVDVDWFAKVWHRESILYSLMLYIDAEEFLVGPETGSPRIAAIHRLLSRIDGGLFFASRDTSIPLDSNSLFVDVSSPTAEEQFETWKTFLPKFDESIPGQLSTQFSLDEEAIGIIVRHVASTKPPAKDVFDRLWAECRIQTRPRLDGLVQRIDSKAKWEDLFLPENSDRQLHQLTDQVRNRWQVYHQWGLSEHLNRGLGISALFAGESGTGKTMAAEVIANDLNLDLFRIDLSSVISKFVGETEKNLCKLFDRFENSGAVLFCDECDALFGKRTEVKDAHDRYANIEVSYLLQRLESYRGLAILATNHRGALDQAFLRRLRFVVTFERPKEALREKIWRHLLPPKEKCKTPHIPSEDLNYSWLAKWDLTGGEIQNVVVNASFLAVGRDQEAVTMQDLRDALQSESQKLNRPFRVTELPKPTRRERKIAELQPKGGS